MMNVSNNIKNTSSVTVLHYVNPKYLWKFSNCVNQSLDQRFKKENKAQAGELSSKARVSSPVRVCDRHLTGAAGAICVTRTTSCPGPSKSLSPHLIHSACCPSFSLLTGHSVTLRHGAVDGGIFSKGGGGNGPLVRGKVSPQQSGRRFYK